ncbi:unnamed protein product [Lactuca virosa]|uniref:F-box domain-containing protein n=1 Tax=Lactuca virosa TaxID=75947 RepID=A0AAU9MPQ3_9ASTR|nr:unnamed protein product [Lactuca virosa]
MQDYTMSDYLCQELIIEIFTRLPPKSLLRFRSLSKSWYSYDFYTLHSEDQLPLCPTGGYNGITAVQFPCSRVFKIVGSCDGIFYLNEYQKGISLWNPSIRRKQSLPDCPRRSGGPSEGFGLGLGLGLGFGFDPISDDYKIVQVSYARESSFFYALKIDTWCAIASPTPLISKVLSGKSCFVNGALHWVVDSYHTESHDTDLPCILTFNLSTHVFGMIPLPEPFWTARGLTTLQGSLAVISTNYNEYDSWIWVRRDDSWSVIFKSKENQFKKGSIMRVLQPTTNGDLLINASMERGEKVQVYLTKMGAQSRLVNFHAASFIFEIVQCVESLHLLDMETDCETNQLSVSRAKKTSQLSVSVGKKTKDVESLDEPSTVRLNFLIINHSYILADSCNLYL